jgi:hypothetical protein
MSEAKEDVNKMKAQLAVKNVELAAAAREAEVLLKSISESTAVAEKEKQKVAVIVDGVSGQGQWADSTTFLVLVNAGQDDPALAFAGTGDN